MLETNKWNEMKWNNVSTTWTIAINTAKPCRAACDSLKSTYVLQFGLKKHIGCNEALFTVRAAIDCFDSHGSNVFAAAFDLHYAFDSVNHMKSHSSLIKSGLPLWFVSILSNWHSKLFVAVRWNGVLSNNFRALSGVRQGSSLSPALFSVFINIPICCSCILKRGCCINKDFIGGIFHADAILLTSASVSGQQLNVKLLFVC